MCGTVLGTQSVTKPSKQASQPASQPYKLGTKLDLVAQVETHTFSKAKLDWLHLCLNGIYIIAMPQDLRHLNDDEFLLPLLYSKSTEELLCLLLSHPSPTKP